MKNQMLWEKIKGTFENDTLNGTPLDDLLLGLKGNDFMFGEDGDDKIIGHKGNDYSYGGSGNDHVIGNQGEDVIFGEAGDDRLHGSHGDDTVSGGSGDDRLFGGHGSDILKGGAGQDNVFAGGGDDFVVHEIGIDSAGKDFYRGAGGFDTIVLVGEAEDFNPDFLNPDLFSGNGKKVDFSQEFGAELNFIAHNFEAVVFNVKPIAVDDVFVIIEGTDLLTDNNVLSNDDDPDDTDTLKVVNVTGLSFFDFDGAAKDLGFMRVDLDIDGGDIAKFQIFDPNGDPEDFNILTINMDGTVDFEHFGDTLLFTQGDRVEFTYMIDDGLGGMDEANAKIHINIPPEAEDDLVTQDEDSAQEAPLVISEDDMLGNDDDPDNLPEPIFIENIFVEMMGNLTTDLGVELVVEANGGGVVTSVSYDATQINFDLDSIDHLEDLNSLRQFTDDDQVEGETFITDTFEYTLSDGLETDMATVTVKITGENDDPFVAQEIEDAQALVGFLFEEELEGVFDDLDFGDELMLTLADDAPDWLEINDTTLSGTPVLADVGTSDVTVIATDGSGATAMDTFEIMVEAV